MAQGKPNRVHAEAWLEIEAADDWYLQRSADASAGFIAAVIEAFEILPQAPHRWPSYLYGTRRLVLQRSHFPSFISMIPILLTS